MAGADNDLAKEELDYLFMLGRRYGLSENEMDAVVRKPDEVDQTALPEDEQERIMYIFDLSCMMLADDVLDEREVELCVALTKNMGLSPSVVGDMVKTIVLADEDGVSRDVLRSEIMFFMDHKTGYI